MSAQTGAETAAVTLCLIVGEAVQAVGSVPSGELYARVMAHMSLETYQSVIGSLKRAKCISESNNVLTWIGPKRRV